MSEATFDAVESEAFEAAGEAAFEGEAAEGSFEGEAAGQAGYEGYGEDARSDARRRARQRQILLARQRQAQVRRPAPTPPPAARRPAVTGSSQRQPVTAIRAMDLDTQMELDKLRRALAHANRMAYRNAWAAEASVAASQVLDSFQTGLEPHDWAKAAIRATPTILLAAPRKPGLEGLLLDPRVAGGALVAAIWAVGHFRGESTGVHSVRVSYTGPLSVPGGANPTAQLTAIALDKAGHVLPNVNFSYIPLTPGYFTISQVSPGVVTLTGVSEGTTWLSVSANGKSDGAGAFITVDPEHH